MRALDGCRFKSTVGFLLYRSPTQPDFRIVLSPPLGIVNTSMHGVSDKFVRRAFETLGYPSYTPVLEQQFPDPEFPTIPFPNPEERGDLQPLASLNFAN